MDLYWNAPAAKWYIAPQDPKRGIFNFVPSLLSKPTIAAWFESRLPCARLDWPVVL
jgi:hypothetical protein